MELQLRVFGFLPTTHVETNTNKMRPQSSRAEYPQRESHAGMKMVQVLGSPVYICGTQ